MNLKLNFVANLGVEVPTEECMNDVDYIELHGILFKAQKEFFELDDAYQKCLNIQNTLKRTKVDNGIYNVLCDSFGMEEYIGLPRNCINAANATAYTEVCLEGLGSYLVDIGKKIVAFFKKLYETVMNFFGIRSFRHRHMENELVRLSRAVDKMDDATFNAKCNTEFKANVNLVTMKTLDDICLDMETMYNLLTKNSDVENVKTLVTATSGVLTKLGFGIANEFMIKDPENGSINYTEIVAGETIKPESTLGIKFKSDITGRLDRILKIQKTLLDVKRWYPMNLQKYAKRAEAISKSSDQESAQQSLQTLNEDQRCQAYLCKYILEYMQIVDFMCTKAVGTFGIFGKE